MYVLVKYKIFKDFLYKSHQNTKSKYKYQKMKLSCWWGNRSQFLQILSDNVEEIAVNQKSLRLQNKSKINYNKITEYVATNSKIVPSSWNDMLNLQKSDSDLWIVAAKDEMDDF